LPLRQGAGSADRVAGIGALRDRHEFQPIGELGGHILGAVHRDVDSVLQQRVLEL
jgi:hypothetical protein